MQIALCYNGINWEGLTMLLCNGQTLFFWRKKKKLKVNTHSATNGCLHQRPWCALPLFTQAGRQAGRQSILLIYSFFIPMNRLLFFPLRNWVVDTLAMKFTWRGSAINDFRASRVLLFMPQETLPHLLSVVPLNACLSFRNSFLL